MISGTTNSPQAEAMQLIKSKRYNLTDIIKLIKKENKNIIIKKILLFKKNTILIVYTYSVKKNLIYIKEFIKKTPSKTDKRYKQLSI